MAVMAEHESRLIFERTKAAMAAAKRARRDAFGASPETLAKATAAEPHSPSSTRIQARVQERLRRSGFLHWRVPSRFHWTFPTGRNRGPTPNPTPPNRDFTSYVVGGGPRSDATGIGQSATRSSGDALTGSLIEGMPSAAE